MHVDDGALVAEFSENLQRMLELPEILKDLFASIGAYCYIYADKTDCGLSCEDLGTSPICVAISCFLPCCRPKVISIFCLSSCE